MIELHRGVYAVGHGALTARSRDMAAVLSGRGCKPKAGITVHRSRLVHPTDRARVHGIPTTSVARTLVDVADVLTERRLADAVNEAELRRLFDLTSVEAALARLPGRRGSRRLRRVPANYTPEPRFTRSQAERLLVRLCAQHACLGRARACSSAATRSTPTGPTPGCHRVRR